MADDLRLYRLPGVPVDRFATSDDELTALADSEAIGDRDEVARTLATVLTDLHYSDSGLLFGRFAGRPLEISIGDEDPVRCVTLSNPGPALRRIAEVLGMNAVLDPANGLAEISWYCGLRK